jgi:malate dehydrogenase (oxaloacetate-decarboxylating)(NADP+)
VFVADTPVHEKPTPEDMADIAVQAAEKVRQLGLTPRVALVSYANFGVAGKRSKSAVSEAVKLLQTMDVDFEFDGEIAADVALNASLLKLYPFCQLTGPANILIMPGLDSANIAYKLMKELGGGSVIGPVLSGLEHPAQIIPPNATVSDILNLTALASVQAIAAK